MEENNNKMQNGFDFKAFFFFFFTACLAGLGGIIVAALAVAGIATFGHIADTNAVTTSAAQTIPEAINIETSTGGAYEKLGASKPVNVLVLGDAFSYGDSSWADLLTAQLGEKYGSQISLDNLSLTGTNDIASGYAQIKNLDNSTDYDLAILSYGNHGDSTYFETFYEATLRALYSKFPNISILSVSEPTSDATASIQKITDHYFGKTIDLSKIMKDHKEDPATYLTDSAVRFNDDGQKIAAGHITDFIDSLVKNPETSDKKEISVLNPNAGALDKFTYIPSGDFEAIDDTTYYISADDITDDDGNTVSGIMLIDYSLIDGTNQFYAAQDKQPFGGIKADYSGPVEEHHISVVNDDFHPGEYLVIEFANAEQAATFNGICVAGAIPLPESLDQFETLELPDLDAETSDNNEENTTVDDGPSSDDRFGSEDDIEEEISHQQDPNAGVYAAGVDHPGAANVVVVKHKVITKKTANTFAPGDETAADGTVLPKKDSDNGPGPQEGVSPVAPTHEETLPQPAEESHESDTETPTQESKESQGETSQEETTPQQTASNGQKLISGNIYQG